MNPDLFVCLFFTLSLSVSSEFFWGSVPKFSLSTQKV